MHDGYGPFIIGQTTTNSSEHRHDGRTVTDGEGDAGRRDQGENDSRKLINMLIFVWRKIYVIPSGVNGRSVLLDAVSFSTFSSRLGIGTCF